jgi:hypothetical protein
MADYSYQIGTSAAAMNNIEDLLSVAPVGSTFNYHPLARVDGNGLIVGDGYATCEWLFEFLSWTDLATMLNYLDYEESVALYINTRRPDDTYAVYAAVMHRPQIPNAAAQVMGGWQNVRISFTHLEAE